MDTTAGFEEFVRTVDEGSVSAAARSLGVPRATLSRRLGRLEERLGVRLLHRSTRRLKLTRAGEELYPRARRIVEEAIAAQDAVRRLDEVPRGLLRVSVPINIDLSMAPFIDSFLAAYPDVELEVWATTRHLDLIAEGIDVALRGGLVADGSLIGRRVLATELAGVASPDYLDARGRPTDPEELADHECILGFLRGERPERFWPLHDGSRIPVSGRLITNDVELRLAVALQGRGIALLPLSFCLGALAAGRLERVLEGALGSAAYLTLVYPEREFLDPKVRAFVDHAAMHLRPRETDIIRDESEQLTPR